MVSIGKWKLSKPYYRRENMVRLEKLYTYTKTNQVFNSKLLNLLAKEQEFYDFRTKYVNKTLVCRIT